jgi:hypothetical protein
MTTSGRPDRPARGGPAWSQTGSEGEPVSAEVAAAWRASEAQLYGSLVWDPELYKRAVTLMGQVVEQLRGLGPSYDELRRAAQLPGELVGQVVSAEQAGTISLDPLLLGQAALSMRLREIVGEQARLRRLTRIAEAAHEDERWVVLEESGEPHGDPLDPYCRLEVEVATGRALYVTVVPDDHFTGVLHEVATLEVDLDDGRVREVAAGTGGVGETPSRHQGWVARERWEDHLRGSPAPG